MPRTKGAKNKVKQPAKKAKSKGMLTTKAPVESKELAKSIMKLKVPGVVNAVYYSFGALSYIRKRPKESAFQYINRIERMKKDDKISPQQIQEIFNLPFGKVIEILFE